MLVLSFLLLVLLLFLLLSLFICLLVKVSIRSLLKGRHAQYCRHDTDWLTENPATRWMCVKKRKWQDGRQSGCQGEAAPRANVQPDSSVSVSSWVPAGSRFHSSGSFTWRGSKLTGLFCYLLLFFYLIIRREEEKDNHPAVCMTRKHQLKTIHCIPYYFMLGWNLSACI